MFCSWKFLQVVETVKTIAIIEFSEEIAANSDHATDTHRTHGSRPDNQKNDGTFGQDLDYQ